jgi:hypothetical protein
MPIPNCFLYAANFIIRSVISAPKNVGNIEISNQSPLVPEEAIKLSLYQCNRSNLSYKLAVARTRLKGSPLRSEKKIPLTERQALLGSVMLRYTLTLPIGI